MNTKTKAIGKKVGKIGKIKDYFTGTRRVDNKANPGSAYSMMMRKQKNTEPRSKQPKGLTHY